MIKNTDYRPNSSRAVFVVGITNQDLAERTTREAVALHEKISSPTTVYIDSPGGSTYYAECIYRTLKTLDQDTGEQRRIITVGLNLVASAACDLLVAADYAILNPHSVLLCHEVRQSAAGLDVTREAALDLAKSLATSNEQYALNLATNAVSRFIFRFVTQRHKFQAIRAERNEPSRDDVFCFLDALAQHITKPLALLLQQALNDTLRSDHADLRIKLEVMKAQGEAPKDRFAFEALILKCLIDHEVELAGGQSEKSFRNLGMHELESRFLILLSSYDQAHRNQIQKLVGRWGEFLLSDQQSEVYSTVPDHDREKWMSDQISDLLRSLWFLLLVFVDACNRTITTFPLRKRIGSV